MSSIFRHPEFRRGVSDCAAVIPGIAAWGMMTGVAMIKSGMSVTEASLMSVMVFAGSSQLAAIPLIGAGAPLWVILAAAFCVNLRFVVFSAHIRPYVMYLPLWRRLYTGYFMSDLSYVQFTARFPHVYTNLEERRAQEAYRAGNAVVNWGNWATTSLIGIFLANAIPPAWGLGFAGVLSLLGVTCSLASTRLRAVSAGVSGAAAVAAFALPLKLNILVAIAAAVALCLLLERPAPARVTPTPDDPENKR